MDAQALTPSALRIRSSGPGRLSWAPYVCAGLLLLELAAVICGRLILPHIVRGPSLGDGLAGRLVSWDGVWYYRIAAHGYSWHPPASYLHYQNIAFFPLQAVIDRAALWIAPAAAPILVILSSIVGGIISIFAFERLARCVLQEDAVLPATLCFALWPTSAFFLMGYPTGIISACVIVALIDVLEGRFWRSAVWLGLGTAAAPTVVFAGAAIGFRYVIRWVREGADLREAARLLIWAFIALSGLFAFILWQLIVFRSPFAFIDAQVGWGIAPGPIQRLRNLFSLSYYIMPLRIFVWHVETALPLLHEGSLLNGLAQIERGVQFFINFALFVTSFAAIIVASIILRGRQLVVAWASWAVFLGYEWFLFSTHEGMVSTPRLLAPGVAIFIGLGLVVSRSHALVRYSILFGLGVITFGEVGLAAAGYWVV